MKFWEAIHYFCARVLFAVFCFVQIIFQSSGSLLIIYTILLSNQNASPLIVMIISTISRQFQWLFLVKCKIMDQTFWRYNSNHKHYRPYSGQYDRFIFLIFLFKITWSLKRTAWPKRLKSTIKIICSSFFRRNHH